MSRNLLLVVSIVVLAILAGGVYYWSRQAASVDNEVEIAEQDDFTDATQVDGEGQFLQAVPEDAMIEDTALEDIVASPSEQDAAVSSMAPLPLAEAEVVISMTEQGFSPSEVDIAVGTTVTFINDGELPHWPASDMHPTHEILPEFDSKQGLQTGETYSYTFDAAGSWQFHDHLNPRLKGTITVTES